MSQRQPKALKQMKAKKTLQKSKKNKIQQQKRQMSTTSPTAASSTDSIKKDGKIDINAVEDVFRANRLAGLGDQFHQLTHAFDLVRSGTLTPQQEQDLSRVFDVTSLRTADSAEVRRAKTKALIKHYERRPGDTGSPEVQCVLLTERVNYLTFHMTRHPQDRKLKLDYNMIIVRRRKMLNYLKQERFRTYQIICRDLGINEEELTTVGRLATKRPYYDPTKPIYRRPLTDAEVKQQEIVLAEEKRRLELASGFNKRQQNKKLFEERRKQANQMDV